MLVFLNLYHCPCAATCTAPSTRTPKPLPWNPWRGGFPSGPAPARRPNVQRGHMNIPDEANKPEVLALRERMELLPWWRGVNPPLTRSVGLVSIACVIDALARRFLAAVASLPDEHSSRQTWYDSYCIATMEISEAVRDAVNSRSLVLRSKETRSPLRTPEMQDWLCLDMETAVVGGLKSMYPACASWPVIGGPWPDLVCIPPGAVFPSDAEAWATSSGIALPGELLRLLSCHQSEDASAHASGADARDAEAAPIPDNVSNYADLLRVVKAAPGAKWQPDMLRVLLAEEQARKNRPGSKGVRKALGLELGLISEQRVGELIRAANALPDAPPSLLPGASVFKVA